MLFLQLPWAFLLGGLNSCAVSRKPASCCGCEWRGSFSCSCYWGFIPHQKPDTTSSDEAHINTFPHTMPYKWRETGGAEQHPGNVRLEAESKEEFCRGKTDKCRKRKNASGGDCSSQMRSGLWVSFLSIKPRQQNGSWNDFRLLSGQKAWYNVLKTVAIFQSIYFLFPHFQPQAVWRLLNTSGIYKWMNRLPFANPHPKLNNVASY